MIKLIIGAFNKSVFKDRNTIETIKVLDYMDSLSDPKDDIDRSYKQFVVKNLYVGKIKKVLLNIMSIFAIPIYSVSYAFTRKQRKQNVDAVFRYSNGRTGESYEYESRYPKELYQLYPKTIVLKYDKYPSLRTGIVTIKGIRLWFSIVKRYPVAPFFLLLSFIHIMSTEKIIEEFSPKAIITMRSEQSPLSSIITLLCEMKGINNICFMHGDYLVNSTMSFVRFSRHYIWNKHYIEVFNRVRAGQSKFIIYMPECLKLVLPHTKIVYDLAYYFEGENENVDDIKEVMCRLIKKGMRIKVRPHPRFSNTKRINEIFSKENIFVESNDISIEESIASTDIICGRRSTVLLQAHCSGKKVYIDDVTDVFYYENLRNLKYILIDAKDGLLSDLIH